MEPHISRAESKEEIFIPEGCYIIEAWNIESDRAVSIARARVLPGVKTKPHRLRGIHERYLMIEGSGRVRAGNMPEQEVKPGDVVFIPAGTTQQITNTGEKDLVFYAICTPAFEYAAYETLE
ncbi:MAG: cupin domain-containing protein [Nitrospiraceae bacterium]|nr:cupin domain-containing protein [Nitrospiraceae bacterium]